MTPIKRLIGISIILLLAAASAFAEEKKAAENPSNSLAAASNLDLREDFERQISEAHESSSK